MNSECNRASRRPLVRRGRRAFSEPGRLLRAEFVTDRTVSTLATARRHPWCLPTGYARSGPSPDIISLYIYRSLHCTVASLFIIFIYIYIIYISSVHTATLLFCIIRPLLNLIEIYLVNCSYSFTRNLAFCSLISLVSAKV